MPKEDLQQDQEVLEVLDHLEVLVLGLEGLEVLGLEGLIMVEVAVPALS